MAPPVFEEREDRLLKKGKIKIIALIGAFVLTVLIVGLINRHSSNDTTDNMAVSYTHLDVYKRQVCSSLTIVVRNS